MPAWTTPGIALTCLLPAALHACLWTNPGVPLTFACMTREHGVTRRIDLVLRVYQAYAVSLGMCVCVCYYSPRGATAAHGTL